MQNRPLCAKNGRIYTACSRISQKKIITEGAYANKQNYVLRTIAGDNLLVPLGGSSTETKGMILLNELSLFVYESIQKGQTEDEILSRILDEYDVEIPQAAADLGEIISEFTKLGIIK